VTLPTPNTRPQHSEKLMRNLTAHRVAAVQAELIDRPDVALVTLTAQLAAKIIHVGLRYSAAANMLTIGATGTHENLRREAGDMADSAAWKKVEAECARWTEQLPEDEGDVFAWLLAQDQSAVLRLLTFLIASSVTGVTGTEGNQQTIDPLAQALALDMTRWWQVSGPSYLDHVPKARIIEAVTEAVGAHAAGSLAGLKKAIAVSRAERALAGTGWLPSCLRTPMRENPSAEEAIGDRAAE
jgi:ParB family chromosome partitioning protein